MGRFFYTQKQEGMKEDGIYPITKNSPPIRGLSKLSNPFKTSLRQTRRAYCERLCFTTQF